MLTVVVVVTLSYNGQNPAIDVLYVFVSSTDTIMIYSRACIVISDKVLPDCSLDDSFFNVTVLEVHVVM